MKKILGLVILLAVVMSLLLVTGASARHERRQGGYISWVCTKPGYFGVPCTVNAYQYGNGAYRNIYNSPAGSAGVGGFTAPYSGTVDMFAHRNGNTILRTVCGCGGSTSFPFPN